MGIEFTKCQQNALPTIYKWFKSADSKQVFRIFGYAGCGKSFIVNYAIEQLGIDKLNDVKYATYTGKSALVLRKRLLPATTIHKLIYTPIEEIEKIVMDDGTVKIKRRTKFVKKTCLDANIKLIVIDECSMVDEKIWNDLLSFNIPLIVLGDSGQLPPLRGKSPITAEEPDVFLDEIVRQSADNPIIYLSMLARQGKDIPLGDYGDGISVITKDDFFDDHLLTAEMVITTTNDLRDELNTYIRQELLGRTAPLPVEGDKLICRKNNWDEVLNGIPLVNGLVGKVVNGPVEVCDYNTDLFAMNFRPEGFKNKQFEGLECNVKMFSPISAKERKDIIGNRYELGNKFEYGYAITTHLSQGSQAEEVLYYYEPFGNAEFRRQLLYTGITRAEKELTLVL